jgi:hypothetical protein
LPRIDAGVAEELAVVRVTYPFGFFAQRRDPQTLAVRNVLPNVLVRRQMCFNRLVVTAFLRSDAARDPMNRVTTNQCSRQSEFDRALAAGAIDVPGRRKGDCAGKRKM